MWKESVLENFLLGHKHTSVMVCFQQRKIAIVIFQSECKLFYYKLPVGPCLTEKSFNLNLSSLCMALLCVGIAKLCLSTKTVFP